ncbi:MAG: 6-hydroxynicotinate reductase [SAR324 cluster bacterium]|nr:6-hydroxynicotinate reductase [SAR324 cluster bacterium]
MIRCDACPVLCKIKPGRTGVCDRYANAEGSLVRVDPLVILNNYKSHQAKVPFLKMKDSWEGNLIRPGSDFVTGVGATTTYPDYKPAPFIVSSKVNGEDTVTVVTEGIFSYCGAKVKIDTDLFLGPEQSAIRVEGEQIGHVTTAEYGSQMMALGGVRHITGGGRKEGLVTCDALLKLCNKEAVEMSIDNGVTIVVQSGKAPIIDQKTEEKMRVGCGSATIGIFALQWHGLVDEVIVVDDHITGVLTEHQAGCFLEMPPSGIKIKGRKSTPGRYFQVADPGQGWGGTNIVDPLSIIKEINPKRAFPGERLLMVSTTGEDSAWFILDEDLNPIESEMPAEVRVIVERITENCEPALCSVLFMAGAGGSLRAGATRNPVLLTNSVKNLITNVTCGGAPCFVWPGGGITLMVDVMTMPDHSFGYVPTPAIVAPIEFTMNLDVYREIGGFMESVLPLETLIK